MIRNAMFYLNQNKPSVFDTVRVCAELCRLISDFCLKLPTAVFLRLLALR